jgi:pimeloyl-ACP methyl ester carboxylesterase
VTRRPEGELVTARRGFFWVGGEQLAVEQGTALRGQMYVQWESPAEVTKPYPIVLVHGGGGQGLDYLGTPDGRPGWATFLLEEGYAVYVVDRPGHGRAPFYPAVLGEPGVLFTLELSAALFTDAANGPMAHPTAHLHTQWPGSGPSARSPQAPGRCSPTSRPRTPSNRRAEPRCWTRSARRSWSRAPRAGQWAG